MKPIETVGIIFNSRAPRAVSMATDVQEIVNKTHDCWHETADGVGTRSELVNTDLLITVGGDGTILRAAQAAAPHKVSILGINLGRLGFMTELSAEEALVKIPSFLNGHGWLEERSMIQVDVQHSGGTNGKQESTGYHALNDVVLGRGAVARVIRVQVSIDGAYLTSYRSDAILICTATGSTGYNLSAGGPILEPQASEMVLKPVAPHVGIATALVLPRSASVELQIESEDPAIFSVDGFLDLRLKKGDTVKVKQSSLTSLFLRERTPQDFYASLTRRLGFESNDGIGRSVSY